MKIYNNTNLNLKHKKGVVAIGNFDGFHLGHTEFLKFMQKDCKNLGLKIFWRGKGINEKAYNKVIGDDIVAAILSILIVIIILSINLWVL